MRKLSNIIWGILFIFIGSIWALNATGIADIDIFFDGWWTLFIIVPSIIGIIENPKDSSGYIFLFIGTCLLLAVRDIISFSLIAKLIVPVSLILIGIGIIFKDTLNGKVAKKISQIDKDGTEIYTATFSENRAKLSNDEFKNARLDATFGGVTFDMRDCNVTEDGVITASAIFGGVTILVPNNVNVKVRSTGIFGGTTNRIRNQNEEGIKTIYIDSFALFGGVEIR